MFVLGFLPRRFTPEHSLVTLRTVGALRVQGRWLEAYVLVVVNNMYSSGIAVMITSTLNVRTCPVPCRTGRCPRRWPHWARSSSFPASGSSLPELPEHQNPSHHRHNQNFVVDAAVATQQQ